MLIWPPDRLQCPGEKKRFFLTTEHKSSDLHQGRWHAGFIAVSHRPLRRPRSFSLTRPFLFVFSTTP